ncbi:MAG: DNA photolyase [Thiotrichales bacterium]|nr:DNA photolyase [Thiotrichales bacterium]
MRFLPTEFSAATAPTEIRALVAQLSGLSPDEPISVLPGGQEAAQVALAKIQPQLYRHDRNFLDGHVTRLSPYVRHGLVSPQQLMQQALQVAGVEAGERFIQQLAWRDYFHLYLAQFPQAAWQDVEPYKTGWLAADYAQDLPADIAAASTGVRLIDQLICELLQQGWLHNHARLYLAAYVVHWRRVRWQAGAQWFLQHLLDGDLASNNLSWQWVASTFSAKPYIFNLENVEKFSRGRLDCAHPSNAIFDDDYDALQAKLFPNL